ncbi:hypothetical protein D3C72_2522090 [compost metagenome]
MAEPTTTVNAPALSASDACSGVRTQPSATTKGVSLRMAAMSAKSGSVGSTGPV